MKRVLVFIALSLIPGMTYAVDFTLSLSAANANRAADAFECTGTNPQKIACVTQKLKDLIKQEVIRIETKNAGIQAQNDKKVEAEQNFVFE